MLTEDPVDGFEGAIEDVLEDDGLLPGGFGRFWILGLLHGVIAAVLMILTAQYVLHRMKQAIFAEEVSPGDTFALTLNPLRTLDFLISGLFAAACIAIGAIFCLLPGLAMLVVFALLPACITFGREAFNLPIVECFQLQRDNRFWITAGVVLILAVLGIVITLGLGLLFAADELSSFLEAGPEEIGSGDLPDLTVDYSRDPVRLGTSLLMNLLHSLLLLVEGFASVIMYFNYRASSPLPAGDP
jgi:hypothetical protein